MERRERRGKGKTEENTVKAGMRWKDGKMTQRRRGGKEKGEIQASH